MALIIPTPFFITLISAYPAYYPDPTRRKNGYVSYTDFYFIWHVALDMGLGHLTPLGHGQ